MKSAVTMIFCMLFGLMAEGQSPSPKIDGDALVWWPRDFKGMAVIPLHVRHIGSEAFSGCSELTAVVFPKSLETIGSFAFSGCHRLREVRIPVTITSIGRSAFFNCQTLTNVVILANIRKIPDNMCSLCYGLRRVEMPDILVEIGDMAFRGCRSLQNIDIPSSVKRIGRGAFLGCSRLSGVELPRTMETVDEFAFYGCFDLRHVIFHSIPVDIGAGAFRDCYGLKGCVISCAPISNVLYCVSSDHEFSLDNICNKEWLDESLESVEDALSAIDKIGGTEPGKGVFEDLERTLRIAADAMVDEMPDTYYPVGTIDSLAAHLFKLSPQDDAQKIKDFFKRHSSSSLDCGKIFVANLHVPGDIAISLEFYDDKLAKLTLSEGLKNVIRRGLKRVNGVADDSILKWLK